MSKVGFMIQGFGFMDRHTGLMGSNIIDMQEINIYYGELKELPLGNSNTPKGLKMNSLNYA